MSEVARKIKLKELVDRFLAWPLPSSVCSDQCVTIHQYPHGRSGTSLLNADEAYQMIEHVVGKDLEDKRPLLEKLTKLTKLTKERDEWKEKYETWFSAYSKLDDVNINLNCKLTEALKERDYYKHQADTYIKDIEYQKTQLTEAVKALEKVKVGLELSQGLPQRESYWNKQHLDNINEVLQRIKGE